MAAPWAPSSAARHSAPIQLDTCFPPLPLFGRERPRRRTELRGQRRRLRLCLFERRFLDVTVAADLHRYRRELDRDRVVGRRESMADLVELRLVLGDERPLGAALRAASE